MILGFTLLNFLIAIVLAIVRKKKGIFGKIPVRTLENEFTTSEKKEEKEGSSKGGVLKEREVDGVAAPEQGG